MQYWRGKEQHCTASRPSRPPGARDPAPHRRKAARPKDRGRAGELRSSWETGSPEEGEGVARGRGEGRRGARGIPEGRFPTPERCARLLFKYSERAARSRRHGNACPSNRLNGCCLATPRVEVLGPPT